MIGHTDINGYRIFLAAYNPTDALSDLYATYALARACELLKQSWPAEVHAWLREHVAGCGPILDAAEAGRPIVREHRDGDPYPVKPEEAHLVVPIIAHLKGLRDVDGR